MGNWDEHGSSQTGSNMDVHGWIMDAVWDLGGWDPWKCKLAVSGPSADLIQSMIET
jgi:hypothetical protein